MRDCIQAGDYICQPASMLHTSFAAVLLFCAVDNLQPPQMLPHVLSAARLFEGQSDPW